ECDSFSFARQSLWFIAALYAGAALLAVISAVGTDALGAFAFADQLALKALEMDSPPGWIWRSLDFLSVFMTFIVAASFLTLPFWLKAKWGAGAVLAFLALYELLTAYIELGSRNTLLFLLLPSLGHELYL